MIGCFLSIVNFGSRGHLSALLTTLPGLSSFSPAWVVFCGIVSLCLAGSSFGLLTLAPAGAGRRHLLAVAGAVLALLGLAACVVGGVSLFRLLAEQFASNSYRLMRCGPQPGCGF
jgi:hypothetical protein